MYQIQQHTEYQWEPIAEGEFDSMEAAKAAVAELERKLGWTNLRIVEVADA